MAKADTVVGIVGALVLVGVMVGVFVYEYNNADTPAGPSVPVAGVDPDGDLDGDGIPNIEDSDLDGDGVPDAEDSEIAVTRSSSGAVGPSAGGAVVTSFSDDMRAEAGAEYLNATVTYEVVAPSPAPPVPNFRVTLYDEDGNVVATGTSTQDGTTVTTFLEVVGDIPADGATYTLEVREGEAGVGGSFEVTWWVVYR